MWWCLSLIWSGKCGGESFTSFVFKLILVSKCKVCKSDNLKLCPELGGEGGELEDRDGVVVDQKSN